MILDVILVQACLVLAPACIRHGPCAIARGLSAATIGSQSLCITIDDVSSFATTSVAARGVSLPENNFSL